MKFEILLETKITKQIQVEADSLEEAMRAAIDTYRTPKTMEVQLSPTWIDTTEAVEGSRR